MKGLQLSVSYNACHQLGVGGQKSYWEKDIDSENEHMPEYQYLALYIYINLFNFTFIKTEMGK